MYPYAVERTGSQRDRRENTTSAVESEKGRKRSGSRQSCDGNYLKGSANEGNRNGSITESIKSIRNTKEQGEVGMKKQVYNPYLPSYEYIPDGEPRVFGDRLYIYGIRIIHRMRCIEKQRKTGVTICLRRM